MTPPMATLDDPAQPNMSASAEVATSNITESSPTQDSSSDESTPGSERFSSTVSETSHGVTEYGKDDGINEINGTVEVKVLDKVSDCTLGSPFNSPKLLSKITSSKRNPDEKPASQEIIDDVKDIDGGISMEKDDQVKENALSDPNVQPLKELAKSSSSSEKTKESIVMNNGDVNHQPREKATESAAESFQPIPSMPPHMRPDFQSRVFRQSGLQTFKHALPPNHAPTGPRNHYAHYESRRDSIHPEQAVRLRAELLKVKNDLHAERTKTLHLRQTIESSYQENVSAAFSTMLTTLLHHQTSALIQKTQTEAHERNLAFREKRIEQYEVFLSEGQKQLFDKLGETGDRPMNVVQIQHIRREAEMEIQKRYAHAEAQLALRNEALHLREQAQHLREEGYKALISDSLRAEIQEATLSSEKVREMVESGFNKGFTQGKEEGRKQACEKALEKGFLDGYKKCHDAFSALSKLKQGCKKQGGEEMNFLFDPAHPGNLFNLGVRIGKMEVGTLPTSTSTPIPTSTTGGSGGSGGNAESKLCPHAPAFIPANEEHDEDTDAVDTPPSPDSNSQEDSQPPRLYVSPFPPAKKTFASELREREIAIHNGDVVLANGGMIASSREEKKSGSREEKGDLIDLL